MKFTVTIDIDENMLIDALETYDIPICEDAKVELALATMRWADEMIDAHEAIDQCASNMGPVDEDGSGADDYCKYLTAMLREATGCGQKWAISYYSDKIKELPG